MRKKIILLTCVFSVAVSAFVGKKTIDADVLDSYVLLAQNVEALSQGGEATVYVPCVPFKDFTCTINFKDMDGNIISKPIPNQIKI